MPINNLEATLQTSVKFYASLTRNQAKGIDAIGSDRNGDPIYVEPGAVCFVADEFGNSIFLNNRLFGDGAVAGEGGLTEVHLSDIAVLELDGVILKTLQDYFEADGTVVSDSFKVVTTATNLEGNEYQINAVVIDASGITIGGSNVITEASFAPMRSSILRDAASAAGGLANTAEQNAKDYANSLLGTVYKIKGSVATYADLLNVENPSSGDVYNVVTAQGTPGAGNYIPAGTNYVYIEVTTGQQAPGYWDAIGGTIDLSAYKTAANTSAEIGEALQAAKDYADSLIAGVVSDISSINTSITGINNTLANHYNAISQNSAAISTNANNITTNSNNINNIVTQLTWQ